MSQMTVEELNDMIRREFPQSKAILETISPDVAVSGFLSIHPIYDRVEPYLDRP